MAILGETMEAKATDVTGIWGQIETKKRPFVCKCVSLEE